MNFESFLTPALSFGASLVMGYAQKKFTPLNNKPIPYRNAAICAGGAGAMTGNPLDMAAAAGGAVAASLVQQLFRKIRGR